MYVGETRRHVLPRVKEHMRHTQKGDTEKSAIAERSYENKHHILFEVPAIIAKIRNYFPRVIGQAGTFTNTRIILAETMVIRCRELGIRF